MTPKDISRFLEKPRKHYAGVRLQQGRLLLDSDFNEGARFADERKRSLLLDMIGPRGSVDQGFSLGQPVSGPIPAQTPALSPGEALPAVDVQLGGETVSVRVPSLRAGSFYLGGRRLTLEAPEPFVFQRDFLQMRAEDLPTIGDESPALQEFRDFYYLHAWDQAVTALEDPEILDPAIGGEDTSVRVRRMRRVEVLGNLDSGASSCRVAWFRLLARLQAGNAVLDRETGELRSRGLLQIVLLDGHDRINCLDCNPDLGSRFLGVDNQTIRIQLTEQGFVWAFDNASPLYKVRVSGLDTDSPLQITVEMLTPPADEQHWPLSGRVVEIIPFGALLQGGTQLPPSSPAEPDPHFKKVAAEVGVFTRALSSFDPDTRTFTLDPEVGLDELKKLVFSWDASHPEAAQLGGSTPSERHFYMRAWHEAPTAADVHLSRATDESGPPLAGTSVVPLFIRDGRPGDYWIVALRPGLPEGVVPFDLVRDGGVPPHGPRHFYAPIGMAQGEADQVSAKSDCRPQIRRLTDKGCTTFTVGDGVNSFGDFTSIQAAIDATPDGGRVSVRTGLYRERITIRGRKDLVLEGCGGATVVETPLPRSPVSPSPLLSPLSALLDIDGSTGITVTGLTLHAVEVHAVIVHNASDNVRLSALGASAGIRIGTRFVPGTSGSTLSLLQVQDVTNVVLEGLILEPVARPTLSVQNTDFLRVSQLTAVGLPDTDFAPSPVMISIASANEVTIEDSILSAFGQVGIEITRASSEVHVRRSSFAVARNIANRTGRITQTQSALSVNGATLVSLEENSVLMEATPSEHAGVVLLGSDLVVRENRVEALAGCFDSPSPRALRSPRSPDPRCLSPFPHAWGGIHVRGTSLRVDLRGNHVVGGVGHGITLGSISWRTRNNLVAQRVGAGRQQMQALPDTTRVVSGLIPPGFSDELRRYFVASDEGSLQDISIVDNRIEGMLTNGISVISVLGVPNGELIDLDRARISGNTISGNLVRPSQNVAVRSDALPGDPSPGGSGTLIPVLPFGGIVLGTVSNGVEIRGNQITNNGSSNFLPINGIFILNGDAITIAENRIVGNGARAVQNVSLRPGVRAGIAVLLAGSGTIDSQAEVNQLIRSPRNPGILASLGIDNNGASLRVLNNTVVHPEGRALHALATGPVAIDGNSLASFGNHGSNVAQDQFGVGDIVLLQNFGPPWEDNPTIPPSGFRVPGTSGFVTRYFVNSPAFSPSIGRFLTLADGGGATLFNNNQVTFDWVLQQLANPVLRAPVAFFPVAILSLDHLGVEGNQFAFRLRGLTPTSRFTSPVQGFSEPVLSHALLVGGTLQVGGNRFAETLRSTILSLLGIAQLMNSSSYNQSTHQVLVTTASDLQRERSDVDSPGADTFSEGSPVTGEFTLDRVGHQVIFSSNNISAGIDSLRNVSLRFLELLNDPR